MIVKFLLYRIYCLLLCQKIVVNVDKKIFVDELDIFTFHIRALDKTNGALDKSTTKSNTRLHKQAFVAVKILCMMRLNLKKCCCHFS